MKTKGLFVAAFLTAGVLLVEGQTNTRGQAASPSNDQGSSAYGNNTYNSGAHHQQAAGMTANSQSATSDSGGNAALQSRINDALRNEPTLGASHVVSNVSDSGIDLSGTVGSTKDRQTAERIASSFDGNRKLTDNIVVTGAGHSDLAPNHPAMNNGGVGNAQNPVTNNPPKQK